MKSDKTRRIQAPKRPPAAIPAIPPGVCLVTLENRLCLIIQEDHSAPVVSAQAWCRAGSIDEGKWLGAGLSHVLEHMLFKGTSTRAAGRIDQEIHDAGGYMNAYTSFDRTVYWINVPNTGARVAIDVLCDIMQNATLPEEEMEKEKQVILREMDMSFDDPSQRSARRLFETAYTKSPYRFPIIGYPDIYDLVLRQDVFDYYKEKYAPNNLFFVVVGDIHPKEVEDQIRAAFAKAKARPISLSVLPAEPRQTAPREVIEEAPIELGYLHFCWHIPSIRHPDVPLLDALATLLGGGRSSRLYQTIREKKGLVNAVDAWTYSPGNPGLIGMSAVVNGDQFSAACQAMLEEVERMKQHPVSPEEFSKVVKQFTAANFANRKTMQGQAQILGSNWLASGDLSFSARYLQAVKQARPTDLQRVARHYLTEENRTLFALLPAGSRPRQTPASDTAVDHPICKFELPNGLRLLVKQDRRLPFVELRALFTGGVLAETPPENGLTLLMSKMLLQGTTSKNAEQIAFAIESIGGHMDSCAANNSFGISAEVLSGDFEVGFALLVDVLLRAAFPKEPLERERHVQLASIRAQRDELLASAFHLMRQGMFGDRGYGLQAIGTETSVQRLQTSDLQHFHDRLVTPNNCVLAIFGDVQPETALRAASRMLGRWRPGAKPLGHMRAGGPAPQQRRLCEIRDKKQAVVVVGFPGTTVHSPDRYALELLAEACSDLGSRLFLRIRDDLGLAYYVGAQNMLGLIPGCFAFYAGTTPNKIALVEKELLLEAEKLRTRGLSAEELNRAKAKIIGQRKIARQDLGAHAISTGLDELYGLGYQHQDRINAQYEAVSLQDIRRIAGKYLKADLSVVSIITPNRPPRSTGAAPRKHSTPVRRSAPSRAQRLKLSHPRPRPNN